ncbi:hypothetical protein Lal_00013840 [Lupinus albus]|nr:hypothetical protein Lal_00013840 [Lupinus albus]
MDRKPDETILTAHLPNLEIQIRHREAGEDEAEVIAIQLRATPSFDAVAGMLAPAMMNPLLAGPAFGARTGQGSGTPMGSAAGMADLWVAPMRLPGHPGCSWGSDASRPAASRPLHFGRQAHQDRLGVAAGLEAEGGAAVVEQVELDIAAAADQLVFALLGGPGPVHVAADQGGVAVEEGGADIAGEGEISLPVARLEVVEEDAADAARLAPVRQEEIAVAPLLVARVIVRVVAVAGGAQAGVEVGGVPLVLHHRRQVGAAAEPALGRHDVAGVHVGRRHQRRAHVRDQADARRPEFAGLRRTGDVGAEFRAEGAVDGRDVDPDLLEHPALHHRHGAAAALAAAMVRAGPALALEPAGGQVGMGAGQLVLQRLEGGADAVAQLLEPGGGAGLALFDGAGVGGCCGGHGVSGCAGAVALPQGLTQHHRRADRNVQGAGGRHHRDHQPGVGGVMHLVGHAGALAADQQAVAGGEAEIGVGDRRPRGQQHQPAALRSRAVRGPRAVARPVEMVEIVHSGAAQPAVIQHETAGFDQIQGHPEPGCESHQGSGVLRNVGFEQHKAQRGPCLEVFVLHTNVLAPVHATNCLPAKDFSRCRRDGIPQRRSWRYPLRTDAACLRVFPSAGGRAVSCIKMVHRSSGAGKGRRACLEEKQAYGSDHASARDGWPRGLQRRGGFPPRFSVSCHRCGWRRRGGLGGLALHRQPEPGGRHPGACLHRRRSGPRGRRSGDHGHLARKACLCPPPHRRGDRVRQEGQSGRPARSGCRRCPREEA